MQKGKHADRRHADRQTFRLADVKEDNRCRCVSRSTYAGRRTNMQTCKLMQTSNMRTGKLADRKTCRQENIQAGRRTGRQKMGWQKYMCRQTYKQATYRLSTVQAGRNTCRQKRIQAGRRKGRQQRG